MYSLRLAFLFGFFACSLLSDTYPRQPGLDVEHYIFRINLSDANDEISGDVTVRIRFVKAGVPEVSLDLASAASAGAADKGMTVSEVSMAGTTLQYKHAADRLTIALPSAPAAGEIREITIRYHGIPAAGLRIGPNKFNERTFFSSNWPNQARQWLPTIDHPYDKATSEFVVTAPAKYQVVANGLLLETVDQADGMRVTHWKQSVPIASWLNTIGVAQFAERNFATVKGIPLQTWVFPQDKENGIATFETPTRNAMEFYIDHIGPYPYEKLADVQAAGVSGGMELASSIFYGEKSVTGRPAVGLVLHEIAHQWFGDSVTEKDWDDVWLSEGFATYFTLLTTEHYEGREAFVAGLKRSREGVFAADKKTPGTAVRHDNLSDMKKVLNQLVYQKGGWTLHMLRAECSGQDLSWFFQQWLNRVGTPVIAGNWHYDPAAKKVEIQLTQQQPGEAYRLPFEVGLAGRIEKVEMTQKQQKFQITVEKEPETVVLDPNTWVLMNATFIKN